MLPLLVPLILLGGATIALAASSAKRKRQDAEAAGPTKTYTLDANMQPMLRDQVLSALQSEANPTQLEAFAKGIEAQYTLAASALRTKAAMLAPPAFIPVAPVPAPIAVQPAVVASPVVVQPPAAVPATQVADAHAPPIAPAPPHVVPPPHIEIPAAVAPTPPPAPPSHVEPLAAVPATPPPAATIAPPTPAPAPSIIPAALAIPPQPAPPILGGLDAGMPIEMQKAVAGAITTETDAAKLQGFASAIQAQYPLAAGLLLAKSQTLRLAQASNLLTAPATPPALPPKPQVTPSPSTQVTPAPSSGVTPFPASGKYSVQSGDFPIRITQRFTGNGNRWKELIAANPSKPTGADGNFKSLMPGEVLSLPSAWNTSLASHALPAAGGTHAANA